MATSAAGASIDGSAAAASSAAAAAAAGVMPASVDAKNAQLDAHRVWNSAPGSVLTTDHGVRMMHTDDSLHAGARGPTLLEDFHMREKVTHFDHERIPERVVHARGSAAHGYFQVYKSLEHLTKAGFLCDPTRKTPVFVRFSTVLGSRGSADTVRDVRGFATRFYTTEGNFDIVGNNIPVFFIQDAIKFPDVIHAGKPEPHNEIPQAATAHDNFWDFISLMPESAHMIMWAMSDRAVPRSFRMMEGFGVHTFALVNARGERRFVKFHWKPEGGVHGLAWDEAQKLAGQDPDFHRRDLWDAIEQGHYPSWELGLQVVEEKDEHRFDFDLLDPTKLIPEELVPVQRVGRLVLNRNPTDFFAETEQVAFCTQNIVPGVDFTDDPLLQGRNFSYLDTQLTRLGGPNFTELPINRPICPVLNNQRDGFMRTRIGVGKFNYYPNRGGGWPCPAGALPEGHAQAAATAFEHYAERVAGIKERMRGPKFQERFEQATLFYNSLLPPEREHLIAAASFELSHCSEKAVRERMLPMFAHIEPELARAVAERLGLPAPTAPSGWRNHGRSSAALSMIAPGPNPRSVVGRKVAVLVADGVDAAQVEALTAPLMAKGVLCQLVAPRLGAVRTASGKPLSQEPKWALWSSRSTMFDAVFVPGGRAAVELLRANADAVTFVLEAFKHCKTVGASGEGAEMLRALPGVRLPAASSEELSTEAGVVVSLQPSNARLADAFLEAMSHHRFWARNVSAVLA